MENSPQCTAAESVVIRYSDMVYRLAFAQTRSRCDADDVYQEVFLRYVRSAPVFESEEHLRAWLLRVTINCAKKHLYSAWRRRTSPLDERVEFAQPEETGLHEALCRLPQKYRAVIHLYYYEGYSTAELGAILGLRDSTVRSQLARARALLREMLKGD